LDFTIWLTIYPWPIYIKWEAWLLALRLGGYGYRVLSPSLHKQTKPCIRLRRSLWERKGPLEKVSLAELWLGRALPFYTYLKGIIISFSATGVRTKLQVTDEESDPSAGHEEMATRTVVRCVIGWASGSPIFTGTIRFKVMGVLTYIRTDRGLS
jgi:hypothetical protein